MNAIGKAVIVDAIDAADEILDPLNVLLQQVSTDPGAPFAPDVLARLSDLKREDRAAFEGLRSQLKKAGCRVTALDHAIAKATGDEDGRRRGQADILIDLAHAHRDIHHCRRG